MNIVKIVSIHKNDAWYDKKDLLIGTTGFWKDGDDDYTHYHRGEFHFDPPINVDDETLTTIFFFKVKTYPVKSEKYE